MSELTYSAERRISAAQFIDVLNRSTLGERRPVHDVQRISAMLENTNLLCTAWLDELLVGVARSVTDFAFCCYLSDLAVDETFQGRGIGTELIRLTQRQLHPDAKLILLAAPKARAYYPGIGMEPHDSAWIASASKMMGRDVALL